MSASGSGPRVVMFDPGSFLPYYVDALCRQLGALGVRVRVIASQPAFEPVSSGGFYHVDRLFFPLLQGVGHALFRRRRIMRRWVKALLYPLGLLRTWRTLRDEPPGILHLQWAPMPVLDALLVRALRAKAWRIVYAVHDPLPDPSRRTAFRHHRALLRAADAVVVHTSQQQRELVRRVPEVAGRVSVIAHGATPKPLPAADERCRCRDALAIDPTRPLLLTFGLIKAYKGLEYLLAAMPDVVARFPNALLLVAGEPLMSLRSFRRQIATLGLREHVSLRPGFVPAQEASVYFRAADVFVAPYVSAGASGTLVMAQEYALPAVVTSVGGLPEFVVPGECGFVVPPRAPAPLAEAICRALDDEQARVQMGLRGLSRLARRNEWSVVAAQTLQLYRTLAPTADMGALRLSAVTSTSQ